MRFRVVLASFAALVAVPLVAAPAGATVCNSATRTVSGTVSGQDWRYVDVLIGFDFLDSSGRHIDARPGSSTFGCGGVSGYGLTLRVNRSLPATGSTTTGTKNWSVTVPTNVKQAFIEVYPQAANDGGTDESRYGHALRRKVPIPYGQSIYIKMPLVCAQGGRTGKIAGYVTKKGVRVKADRAATWSMAADNNTANPILGWNVGTAQTTGYYYIPNLYPGQYYVVQVRKDGVLIQKANVWVNACKTTPLNIAF